MRIGTNSIYKVKIAIHFVEFHKFVVRFLVKDMIMGNNTTDYASMDEKYFFIMISYVIKQRRNTHKRLGRIKYNA